MIRYFLNCVKYLLYYYFLWPFFPSYLDYCHLFYTKQFINKTRDKAEAEESGRKIYLIVKDENNVTIDGEEGRDTQKLIIKLSKLI